MLPHLLVVDDEEDIRTQMKWALSDDYRIAMAGDRADCLQQVKALRPAVVLLDLGLPPAPNDTSEGFAALQEILVAQPYTKVIVITGQGEKENALRAVREGAYDFLCKPISADEMKVILKRANYVANLEREHREMQRSAADEGFQGMLGTSPQIQQVFNALRKVATTDAPVLILGESGTGKEMAALALHRLSRRAAGPFVAINCSAIPETLLESELFGHEKGSFTGAHVQRKGRIEMAEGGTLFLDEIGELPAAIQVKLLRFLQEQQVERVGGREQINIDTRVIAATNSDLRRAMEEGRFREDLYFRLAVVVLKMPPLREREGDIQELARAFLKRATAEHGSKVTGFSQKTLKVLEAHGWPGNIRELENRVRRAVIMADGRLIKPSDLELGADSDGRSGATLKEARESMERNLIRQALARARGNVSRAASDLGVSRPTLYEMMEKLEIER